MKLNQNLIKKTILPYNSIKCYNTLYKNILLGLSDNYNEDKINLLLTNTFINGTISFYLKKQINPQKFFCSTQTIFSYSQFEEEHPLDYTLILKFINNFNKPQFLITNLNLILINNFFKKNYLYLKARLFFYNYKFNIHLFYIISKQTFSFIKFRISKKLSFKLLKFLKKKKKQLKFKNKNYKKKKNSLIKKFFFIKYFKKDILKYAKNVLKKIKHVYLIPIKKFKNVTILLTDIHQFFISCIKLNLVHIRIKIEESEKILKNYDTILNTFPINKTMMVAFALEDLILSKKKYYYPKLNFGYTLKSKINLINKNFLNLLYLKNIA